MQRRQRLSGDGGSGQGKAGETLSLPLYERLKVTMKPVKGTKARKPKPHSLGGKRAAVAKAARRATPATRGQHSRAEVKRAQAAKAAAEASAAVRLGQIRKGPVRHRDRCRVSMPSCPIR